MDDRIAVIHFVYLYPFIYYRLVRTAGKSDSVSELLITLVLQPEGVTVPLGNQELFCWPLLLVKLILLPLIVILELALPDWFQ